MYWSVFDVNHFPYIAYFALRIGIAIQSAPQDRIMRISGWQVIMEGLANYNVLSSFLLKIYESGLFRELEPHLKRMEINLVSAYFNEVRTLKSKVSIMEHQIIALGGGGGGD